MADAPLRPARSLGYRLTRAFGGWLVACFLRALGFTWRIERIGEVESIGH